MNVCKVYRDVNVPNVKDVREVYRDIRDIYGMSTGL